MSLLLLFNDQVAAGAGVVPNTTIWLETDDDVFADVSSDFRRVSIVRGRGQELDRYQAGTAEVVLSDRARNYDPSYTAGPFAGKLRPMRALQIRSSWAGVTYPVFAGYVDSFRHDYAGPREGDATCTIAATDGFKVLAGAGLASSAYAQEVAADGPVAWWRLGEAAGSTVAEDSAGATPLQMVGGAPVFGTDGLVARDGNGALTLATVSDRLANDSGVVRSDLITAAPITVEFLIQTTDATGTIHKQASSIRVGGGAEVGWAMYLSGGDLWWTVATWNGVPGSVDSYNPGGGVAGVNDGQIHHVVGTFSAAATALYVDGVLATSAAGGSGQFITAPGRVLVGSFGDEAGDDALACVLDEVAIYDQALTAERVAAHAEAVGTPWDGDTAAARLHRVADVAGWPVSLRDFDTGTSTLQSADLGGDAVLDHAQKVAETDFGLLFVTAGGTLRFVGRDSLFNQTQQATFGDDGAELPYRTIRPELGDTLIRNDVTVSRVEGTAQRVEDTTSIGTYLRHSYTADGLLHDDDATSRAAAEFLLAEYATPKRRINELVVVPAASPALLYPQVLGRDLSDQITVLDRPPGGGDANTADVAIEGIRHTIVPLFWETTWVLAPSFGSLGTPTPVGVWDVTLWDQSRWGF